MDKKNKKTAAGLVVLILIVALFGLKVGSWLPVIGDHNSPANAYLSPYYILHAEDQTHSPNIVTAVLADYRGFDTLFETCVLFLSGVAALMVLSTKVKVEKEPKPLDRQETSFSGTVLDASFRLVVPVIMIYGIYVLFHGEVSLGGGFQAGALLACAYLIDRIVPSFKNRFGYAKEEFLLILSGIGVFIYAFTGLLPMLFGGNFLEYECLPFGAFVSHGVAGLHAAGILMIEIGVTVCVMAVIINILEVVLERTDFDD